MAKVHQIVVTIIYVLNHLKDSVGWIEQTLKVILKTRYVAPCPYVLNSLPPKRQLSTLFFLMNFMQLVVDILKDPIPTIKKKKKLVIRLQGTSLIQIWGSLGRSCKT